jgi:hypothetical protein
MQVGVLAIARTRVHTWARKSQICSGCTETRNTQIVLRIT